jgi:glucose dehydrogenase
MQSRHVVPFEDQVRLDETTEKKAPKKAEGDRVFARSFASVAMLARVRGLPENHRTTGIERNTSPAQVDVTASSTRTRILQTGSATPHLPEQRFSPLDKINVENVGNWPCVVARSRYESRQWTRPSSTASSTRPVRGARQAIDAASGKLLWQFDPKVPGEFGVKACCDTVNRGVAAYKGRLYRRA